MFESLDEQMKRDEDRETTPRERMMHWALAILITVLVLGGLYFGVQMLDGA
jgi:cytochrome b subunit of formate dehydrogenase